MLQFEFSDKIGGRLHRRQWLCCGALGGLAALTCQTLGSEKSRAKRGFGKAKSVLLLYASGGQSHIDMWDPKPRAADQIRGQFSSISTSVPGVSFTEHMPQIAKIADRWTVVRSMSHKDLDHGSAGYLALTGRYYPRLSSNPPVRPTDYPTMGAVLQRLRRSGRFPYDAIHLNGPLLSPIEIGIGQNGGFLGRKVEPLVIGEIGRQPIAISGLSTQPQLPTVRLKRRLSLKSALDGFEQRLAKNQRATELNIQYKQALQMLGSARCRKAFDMSEESPQTRDQYGRNRTGQACLLARRLVQAEVPFVNVFLSHTIRGQDVFPGVTDQYGWDTHNDIFVALQKHLLPRFDQAVTALILDLEKRGLLDQTLVICMGEFGRAPQVKKERSFAGNLPGRKHWAEVYSIAMAGAGIKRGTVIGKSDRLGGSPLTKPFGPWDVVATIFHSLGINPAAHFRDELDRPFPVSIGKPMLAVYGP